MKSVICTVECFWTDIYRMSYVSCVAHSLSMLYNITVCICVLRLMPHIKGNVGLVFTKSDLSDVRKVIDSNKVMIMNCSIPWFIQAWARSWNSWNFKKCPEMSWNSLSVLKFVQFVLKFWKSDSVALKQVTCSSIWLAVITVMIH